MDYSIYKIFRDVNSVYFISNVIRREHEVFIICNEMVGYVLN